MSLTDDQQLQHCQTILSTRRIFGKPVILCEGEIQAFEGRRSPQLYRKMAQMPDSSFYKACLPKSWTQKKPEFFNCGGRSSVIATYFLLKKLHQENPEQSYLTPDQLFAIIDLDIQNAHFEGDYHLPNSDRVFTHLYDKLAVCPEKFPGSKIWTTGLIHKEAYFLHPQLQVVFDDHPVKAEFSSGNPIQLSGLYRKIADETLEDTDLNTRWSEVNQRAAHCDCLDCSTPETWKNSWLTKFQDVATDEATEQELIFALLSLRKAKPYWEALRPEESWAGTLQGYRDQLTLAIARWYSQHCEDPRNHIAHLLYLLHRSYYNASG